MTSKLAGAASYVLRFSAMGCLLLGCTADPPVVPKYDLGQRDVPPGRPDWPQGCPGVPTLASPVISVFPNPTTSAQQAFRGSALGAQFLTARSGVGTFNGSVSGDGKFCIEVQLLPDSPNTVVFQGVDSKGCPGKETSVSITHHTGAKQDGGVSAPVNLALGAPITTDKTPDEGALTSVNDGDPNSFAKLSYFDVNPLNSCSSYLWVKVDLGKVYTISKAKVIWGPGAGSEFAECFAVLLSAQDTAGDPSTSSGEWKVVKQESNNTTADERLLPINPEAARWAALLLYDDYQTYPFETFKLGEFEVWGQDPNATPPPPPDRCQ